MVLTVVLDILNLNVNVQDTRWQETNYASALELFIMLADPCNGIGGGQHSIISTALQASPFQTFHVIRVRHMMRMCIPSIVMVLTVVLDILNLNVNLV